jgi:hypothetical protein
MSGNLTIDEHSVRQGVHGPNIGGPVGVAESPREWKESAEQLRDLSPSREWPECSSEDGSYANAEFDAVCPLHPKEVLRMQTVGSEQIHKVRGRQIQIDVLEAQQCGEKHTRSQKSCTVLGVDQGEDEDSV